MPAPHPILRDWREDDLPRYVAIHTDPAVDYWLGGPFTAEQAIALFKRDRAALERDGWGIWAVQDEYGRLLGAAGLKTISEGLPYSPAVEAAWRLDPAARGKGLITKAMIAVVEHAFDQLSLDILFAMTAMSNIPSRSVMDRLGFTHVEDQDFDHPKLPNGHPLRRHVVYRRVRAAEAA